MSGSGSFLDSDTEIGHGAEMGYRVLITSAVLAIIVEGMRYMIL
jgi:hypothetical protein